MGRELILQATCGDAAFSSQFQACDVTSVSHRRVLAARRSDAP